MRTINSIDLGQVITQRREALGLSTRQLAERADLHGLVARGGESAEPGEAAQPCPTCDAPMQHEVGEGCPNPDCDFVVPEPDPEGVNDGIRH